MSRILRTIGALAAAAGLSSAAVPAQAYDVAMRAKVSAVYVMQDNYMPLKVQFDRKLPGCADSKNAWVGTANTTRQQTLVETMLSQAQTAYLSQSEVLVRADYVLGTCVLKQIAILR